MGFTNPIVSGSGSLVLPAIRSPNYVAGVTGWTINRDGSADFNDITLRGELLVTDPDGSYVRIYDEPLGPGATIRMNPADQPGATIDSGYLTTSSSSASANLSMESPSFNNAPTGYIQLSSIDAATDYSWVQTHADEVSVHTSSLAGNGLFRVANNGASPDQFRIEYVEGDPAKIQVDERTLGFNVANIHMLTPPAPAGLTSGTPITITGASTTTFVKEHDETDVEIYMAGGGYITAGTGASVTFGVLFDGGVGDFSITRGSFSALSVRLQFSATRLISGIPAGSYTVTPRWFRNAGTSTITMDASDASLSVALREVREP